MNSSPFGRRLGIIAVAVLLGCSSVSGLETESEARTAVSAAPQRESAGLPTRCRDEPGMAYIPGGAHRARGKTWAWRDVQVEPFWLDRYEVTVEQYRECVDAGACKRPHPSMSGYTDAERNPLVCTWEIEGVANLPINCVDGYDQDSFCGWVGKRAPIAYEWTWAAQGRDEQRRYPWGERLPTCELAIVDTDLDDGVRGCGAGRPWPVGSRSADRTRDGVFDMQGNLGEKTVAAFRDDMAAGFLRDVFGASWRTLPSPKGMMTRSLSNRDNFSDNSGFRCAKDAGEQAPCTVAD